MMRKITYIIILIFVLLGISGSHIFVMGQYESDVINQEIQNLNSDISGKKNEVKKMQDKQKELELAIQQKQAEKASLNNQLAILDNRLAKSQIDMEIVTTDIQQTNLEIDKTNAEIAQNNLEIETEKQHISDVLNLMNQKDNVSTLEILLMNNSLGEFLSQVKYLEDINANVKESLDELEKLKRQMEVEASKLDSQKKDLAKLQQELELKQTNLENEKQNKTTIVAQVGTSEKQYQRLLAQAKKEQEAAAADIAAKERQVREKLAKLQNGDLKFNDAGMIWPVPSHIINAYFHDPDYPFRYVFEHPALDIKAGQGTAIRAAASGYVARAKNSGMGYSYIMLVHGDNLSTVYGHVSKISVKEDDFIVQGQVIGYSGGMPGTPGAGGLTTGPHLHFEVRLNGIPVDPLGYLPN